MEFRLSCVVWLMFALLFFRLNPMKIMTPNITMLNRTIPYSEYGFGSPFKMSCSAAQSRASKSTTIPINRMVFILPSPSIHVYGKEQIPLNILHITEALKEGLDGASAQSVMQMLGEVVTSHSLTNQSGTKKVAPLCIHIF